MSFKDFLINWGFVPEPKIYGDFGEKAMRERIAKARLVSTVQKPKMSVIVPETKEEEAAYIIGNHLLNERGVKDEIPVEIRSVGEKRA